MKKILLLALLLTLILTACKEDEEIKGPDTPPLPETSVEDPEIEAGVNIGNGDVSNENSSGGQTDEKPVKLKPVTKVERPQNESYRFFYIENDEVKDLNMTRYSTDISYNGQSFHIEFDYGREYDRVITSVVEHGGEHWVSIETIPKCPDKLLVNIYDHENQFSRYRLYDMQTGKCSSIWPNDFESGRTIWNAYVSDDATRATLSTSDGWYYWDGVEMMSLDAIAEKIRPEFLPTTDIDVAEIYLVEDKLLFYYLYDGEDQSGRVSCISYDPNTSETICTMFDLQRFEYSNFNFLATQVDRRFYISTDVESNLVIFDCLTGQEKTFDIKWQAGTSYGCKVLLNGNITICDEDDRFYVINPYSGRIVACSEGYIYRNVADGWYVVVGDSYYLVNNTDMSVYRLEGGDEE